MGLMDFFSQEAGQERRRWLDKTIGDNLSYYLGGTGIDEKIGQANELLNPVMAMERASAAGTKMLYPGVSGWDRAAAGGDMLLETAGIVAPAAAARVGGLTASKAAEGLTDALTGMTAMPKAAASEFAADEFGGMALDFGRSDPAKDAADKILAMLKSGRASEVTDEMMDLGDATLNARMNEHLFNNYDLPMDTASRMARADGSGFTNGNPRAFTRGGPSEGSSVSTNSSAFRSTPEGDGSLFHATDADVNAFDDTFLGKNTAGNATDFDDGSFAKNLATLGHWTNSKPLAEAMYSGADMPLVVRGKMSDAKSLEALNNRINRVGIGSVRQASDGVRVADEEFGGVSSIIFDPANIRSRFARFDPRLSHLKNLSASIAGPLMLGVGAMSSEPAKAAPTEAQRKAISRMMRPQ